MEPRKITIVSTRDQKKSVIMSSATTLAELKTDLRVHGIDYTDMTFYEGTARIELKDDASALPHDVPYKGTITNELVFMLTNADKKIKSGAMSRSEAYNEIKAKNLTAECYLTYGKNFTQCSTADLIYLLEKHNKNSKKEVKEPAPNKNTTNNVDRLFMGLNMLVDYLFRAGYITDSQASTVKDVLYEGEASQGCESALEPSYSDSDIVAMFDFVG